MPKDTSNNLNQGLPAQDGLDDVAVAEITRRLGVRHAPIVGNLADVQRAGAIAAGDADAVRTNLEDAPTGSDSFEKGVELPPGTSAEQVKAEQKAVATAEKAIAKATDEITAATSDDSTSTRSKRK